MCILRKSLLGLMLFSTIAAAGWKAKIPTKLAGGEGRYFMNPVWSPAGDKIAFSEMQYRGLWIINPDGSDMEQLSDEIAAGFGLQWSPDGGAIVSRVAKYEGWRRYNAVKLFETATKQSRLLSDYRTFMPGLPQWAEGNRKVFMFDGGKLEILGTGLPPVSGSQMMTPEPVAFLCNGKIAAGALADHKVMEPVAGKQYLNLVLSPDRQQVAFEVKGGNLHVMNLDGSGLRDLGPGNRPHWSPDSRYLVYMIPRDNGHDFVSSELFIVSSDGGEKTQLTHTPYRVEMDPSWGSNNRIVYDTYEEGDLYLIELVRE
jgi:Tol biopolymer transport system component